MNMGVKMEHEASRPQAVNRAHITRAGMGALLLGVTSLAQAGIDTYKDWAIACDNTRHCQAVGFQAESDIERPVAFLLARDAGPNAPLKAEVTVVAPDDAKVGRLRMKVGNASVSGVTSETGLTAAQIDTLLPAMLNASEATLTDGKNEWSLSLAGMKAALLKMDEQQGRLGTPGALIRKGSKPESAVPQAVPAPVLIAKKLPAARPGDQKLLEPILKSVKQRDCWEDLHEHDMPAKSITRLGDTQVLVMRECSRGAYQGSYNAWIANDKPPYAPKPVLFPSADGKPEESIMNADFGPDGILHSHSKGRGLGDCIYSSSWLWTAQGFKLLSEDGAPFCRGIPGGGYPLRTWIAVQGK